MHLWGCILVVLSGCQLVFPLEICEGIDGDGDGFPDDCDNCPSLPNADQADTTEEMSAGASNDGVGDACDPHPDREDQIALVLGFERENDNASWEPITTTLGWTFDGKRATYFQPDTLAAPGKIAFAFEPPARPLVLDAEISIDASGSTLSTLLVIADGDRAIPDGIQAPSGVGCGVQRDDSGDYSIATEQEGSTGQNLIASAERHRVRMIYEPPFYSCLAPPVTNELTVNDAPDGRELHLFGRGGPISIESLVIYTLRQPE